KLRTSILQDVDGILQGLKSEGAGAEGAEGQNLRWLEWFYVAKILPELAAIEEGDQRRRDAEQKRQSLLASEAPEEQATPLRKLAEAVKDESSSIYQLTQNPVWLSLETSPPEDFTRRVFDQLDLSPANGFTERFREAMRSEANWRDLVSVAIVHAYQHA